MADSGLLALFQAGLTSPELVRQAQNAKVLQDIYAMRNAGLTDDAIRGLAGQGSAMSLGGGYGFLDPAAESARIASAYSLARAEMARQLDNDRFAEQMQLADRASSPYNVVGYLEALKRTGAAYPLMGNQLSNIAIPNTPAESPERKKLGDFLRSDEPEPFAAGGTRTLAGPHVLVDTMGRPRATFAENGPERLTATPMRGVSRRLGRQKQRGIVRKALGPDEIAGHAAGGVVDIYENKPVDVNPSEGRTRPRFGRRFTGGETKQRIADAYAGRPLSDVTYETSTSTRGIRPQGQIAIGGTQNGAAQLIANPVGMADPNKNYINRVDTPGGPGRWEELSDDEAQRLAAQAFKARIDAQTQGVGVGDDASPAQRSRALSGAKTLLEANAVGGFQGKLSGLGRLGLSTLARGMQSYDPAAAQAAIDAKYLGDISRNRAAVGQPPVTTIANFQSGGGTAPALGGNIPQTGPAGEGSDLGGYTEAQQQAARLLAAIGNNTLVPQEYVADLRAGRIPGLGAMTPQAWSALDRSQRAALAGAMRSTGWVGDLADIDASINRLRPA